MTSLKIALMAATAVLAAAAATPAYALSATPTGIPFNEALNFSYNPNATGIGGDNTCCDYVNVIKSAPASPATVTYAQSGPWGSVSGSASADLSTGQLKVRSTDAVGDGSAAPSIQTNAIFGDSFTTTTPGGLPFSFTSATQAAFTLKLTGSLTSSAPLSTIGGAAFVVLSILQPGTLDPAKPLVNGPTAEQYFYWNIGNPTLQIYYTDQLGHAQVLTPTANLDTVPQTLTAAFTPGGDFDWVLLLGASGQLNSPGASFDLDLSHTLNLSYAGPQGSVTTAGSGQFANFDATLPPSTAVPEPGTMLLLASGLLMIAVRRRA